MGEITEYRLDRLEKNLDKVVESLEEVRNTLVKVREDVAVQKAKTSFLGAAAGALASIPALVLSLVGLGGGQTNAG